MTTPTFERSYFAEHGDDATSKQRQADEAEREHHERITAVRVIAGLATDIADARTLMSMLGLTTAEIREARDTVRVLPAAATVAMAPVAAVTAA